MISGHTACYAAMPQNRKATKPCWAKESLIWFLQTPHITSLTAAARATDLVR